MGEVYRTSDEQLNRDVAVKVLPATLSQEADRLRRFEQEAQAAGALSRDLIKEIMPADPAGISSPKRIFLTPDGKGYAYSVTRMLSDLYVVEGLWCASFRQLFSFHNCLLHL